MIDIIVPVFNEGKNILPLINKLEKLSCKFIISICYDSENDITLKYINNRKNIRKVKNPSIGPASAIIEGIKSTKCNVVVVYMADDLDNINLIEKMYEHINKGYDLIIPSRFIEGGEFNNKIFYKKIITVLGSFLVNKLSGIPFKDTTNAFKMFKIDILEDFQLRSTKGFAFALELTIKAYLNNNKILEIPAVWNELPDRKSNFKIIRWLPYYIYWLFYAFIKNRVTKTK